MVTQVETALSLVEEALRRWHRLLLKQQLKAGYQAMAAEDLVASEAAMRVAWAAIKWPRSKCGQGTRLVVR